MSPRILIAVVLALVAGLLLGRMGPQADLRRANEQIKALREEASKKNKPGPGAQLSGVKSMFKVSSSDLEAGAKARKARESAESATETAAATNAQAPAPGTNAATASAVKTPDREAVSNQIQKLKAAWSMRSDIARTNFIARAKLNEAQQGDFAVLVDAMNLRLGSAIDKWAAVIREEGQMTPEMGVRMMTELGNAMVLTYDEFDRKMPPDWRQNAGSGFEMVDFVDPEVLTPLQDVEGIINQAQSDRRKSRPGGPPGAFSR